MLVKSIGDKPEILKSFLSSFVPVKSVRLEVSTSDSIVYLNCETIPVSLPPSPSAVLA